MSQVLALKKIQFQSGFGLKLIVVAAALLLSSCAVPGKMPFTKEYLTTDPEDGALMLMTITANNVIQSNRQPNQLGVRIRGQGGKKVERQFAVQREDKVRPSSKEEGSKFFVRFQLPAGKYQIVEIIAYLHAGAITFTTDAKFEVPEHGTVYLGDLYVAYRKVRPDERGIRFSDLYDTDVPAYKERFEQLRNYTITKQLLR